MRAIISVILFYFTIMDGFAQNYTEKLSILFLGDSYTIGEGVVPMESYPFKLMDLMKKQGFTIEKHKIMAKTGWTTGDLMDALLLENDDTIYDLVFLLIGVNNQYQNLELYMYKKEFNLLINHALDYARNNEKRVYVVSIPDYGFTPFGKTKKEKIGVEIDMYNQINKDLAQKGGVKYVDITDISRNAAPDMVCVDKLHPSALQYGLWANRIWEVVKRGLE